jgi:hypothetical protein
MQVKEQVDRLLRQQRQLEAHRSHLLQQIDTDGRAPRADWGGAFEWDTQALRILQDTFHLRSFRYTPCFQSPDLCKQVDCHFEPQTFSRPRFCQKLVIRLLKIGMTADISRYHDFEHLGKPMTNNCAGLSSSR